MSTKRRIGQVGIVLLDLFYGVNQDRNVIKLVDDFVPRFEALAEQNRMLHAEMTSTQRYKNAMRKAAELREGNAGC